MMHQDDATESKQKITNGFVDSIMASSCSLNGTMNANSLGDGCDSGGGEQGCDSGGGEQDHLSSKDGSVSSKSGSPSPSPDSCSPYPNDHEKQDQYPEENKHQLTMVPGLAFFSHGERKDGDSGFISPEGNVSAAGVIERGSLHSYLLQQSGNGLVEVKPTNDAYLDEEFNGIILDNVVDNECDVLVPDVEAKDTEFDIKDLMDTTKNDGSNNFAYVGQINDLGDSIVNAESIGIIGDGKNLEQEIVFNDESIQTQSNQLEDNDKNTEVVDLYANCKQDERNNAYDPMTTSMIEHADHMTSSMMDFPIKSDKTDDESSLSLSQDKDFKFKVMETEDFPDNCIQDNGCQAYDPMTTSMIADPMKNLPLKRDEREDESSASSSEDEEDHSEKKDEEKDQSDSSSSSEGEEEDISHNAVQIDNMKDHSSKADANKAEKEIVDNSSFISENNDSFNPEFATCLENYSAHSKGEHSNSEATSDEESEDKYGYDKDLESEKEIIKCINTQYEDLDDESHEKLVVQNKNDNFDGPIIYNKKTEENDDVHKTLHGKTETNQLETGQFDDRHDASLLKSVGLNKSVEEVEEEADSETPTIEHESKQHEVVQIDTQNKTYNESAIVEYQSDLKSLECKNEQETDIASTNLESEKDSPQHENKIEKSKAVPFEQSFSQHEDDKSDANSTSSGESEDSNAIDIDSNKENTLYELKTSLDDANCITNIENDSTATEEEILGMCSQGRFVASKKEDEHGVDNYTVPNNEKQVEIRLGMDFDVNFKTDNKTKNENVDDTYSCIMQNNLTSSSNNVYQTQETHNDKEKIEDKKTTLTGYESEDQVFAEECKKYSNKHLSSDEIDQVLNDSNNDEQVTKEESEYGIMRESMVTNISEGKTADFGLEFNDQYKAETDSVENAQAVLSEQTSFQIDTDDYIQQTVVTSLDDSYLQSQLVSNVFSCEEITVSEAVLNADQNQDHISTMMNSPFTKMSCSQETSKIIQQSHTISAEKSLKDGKEMDYNESSSLCDIMKGCKDDDTEDDTEEDTEDDKNKEINDNTVGDKETCLDEPNEVYIEDTEMVDTKVNEGTVNTREHEYIDDESREVKNVAEVFQNVDIVSDLSDVLELLNPSINSDHDENKNMDGNALFVGDIKTTLNETNESDTKTESEKNVDSNVINKKESIIENKECSGETNPVNLDDLSAPQNTINDNKEEDTERKEMMIISQLTNGCQDKALIMEMEIKNEPNINEAESSKIDVNELRITENNISNTSETVVEKCIISDQALSLKKEKEMINNVSELKNTKVTEKEPRLQQGQITTEDKPKVKPAMSGLKKSSEPTASAKPRPHASKSAIEKSGKIGSQLSATRKSIPPAKGSTTSEKKTPENTCKTGATVATPKTDVSRTTQASTRSTPRPGTTRTPISTSASTKTPISRPLTAKPTSGPAKTAPLSRPQSAKPTSGTAKTTSISRPQTAKPTASSSNSTPLSKHQNTKPTSGPAKTTAISRPKTIGTTKTPTAARTPLSTRTAPLTKPTPIPSTLRPRPTSTSRLRAASAARKSKTSSTTSSPRTMTSKEKTTATQTASSRSRATVSAKPTTTTSRTAPLRSTPSNKMLASKTQEKTLNKTLASKPSTLKKPTTLSAQIQTNDLGKSEVSVEENVLIKNAENKVNGMSNGLLPVTNGMHREHVEQEIE